VSLSDGVFEALLIRNPKNVSDLSRIVTSVLSQNYNNDHIVLLQSKELKFEFPEPVAWTRDGEAGGVVREIVLRNNHAAVNIIA
jgi:diacylglycerol kinase family enzyme